MSGRSPRWIPAKFGTRVGALPVGSTVKLNLNGTPWDWLVVHQGLPSDIYDVSCDGTWLLLKDIFGNKLWGYQYLNSNFQELFDGEIQGTIKQVKIPYWSDSEQAVQTGANGMSTKAFLLSGYEVGFTTSDRKYLPVDGTKLDYFDGGSAKRVAKLDGASSAWWLRSVDISDSSMIYCVRNNGSLASSTTSAALGIRPAIILPSSFRISEDLITYPTA